MDRIRQPIVSDIRAEVGRAAQILGKRRRRAREASAADRLLERIVDLALAPLYGVYGRGLRTQVMRRPRPRHVAIIMDGNRRWAREEGLREPGAGHSRGADKILEMVAWCGSLGIGEITFWALSLENLERTPDELEALVGVFVRYLRNVGAGASGAAAPMRVRVIGRRDVLPPPLRSAIESAEAATASSRGPTVTFALAYSGHEEIVDACRDAVRDLLSGGVEPAALPDRITDAALAAHLYTSGQPDPDLIIRTSGEVRLSGFLPWQSAHSEFYFCDVYWPAFREIDFLRALRTFQQRARRFGR